MAKGVKLTQPTTAVVVAPDPAPEHVPPALVVGVTQGYRPALVQLPVYDPILEEWHAAALARHRNGFA
jgi:mRNA-degrading endonuclease toxin of MazEF toxin-antitoxin module